MYAVSLLPIEYKSYQSSLKRNDKLIFIGLIAAIGSLIVLVTLIAISSVYDQELNRAKSDNSRVMKQIDELKPVELLQTTVSNMFNQINQAAGLSPSWDLLIADIGNSISPKLAFTSVIAQYKDQSGNLVIIGSASSHVDVSDLIQVLSTIDGLGEIQCKISSKTDPEQPSDIKFELDVQLLNGTPYELSLGGEN